MDGIIAEGVCHTKKTTNKRKMHQTENIKVNEYWTEEKKKKKKNKANCSTKEDSTQNTYIQKNFCPIISIILNRTLFQEMVILSEYYFRLLTTKLVVLFLDL